VPQHHRELAWRIANAAFGEIVHVGTADSNRRDAYLHLSGSRIRQIHVDNPKFSDSNQFR
jgi:hypothetical protein